MVDRIVLLSGAIAVGKTSVRDVLVSHYGYACIRSSAYLRSLMRGSLPADERVELQKLGDELDAATDYYWVIEQVARPAIAGCPNRFWLFDAVRKHRQVQHFRAEYGSAVLHVHLSAPEQVLQQRYATRSASFGERVSYAQATSHANEVAARGLSGIADLIIDTSTLSPLEVAKRIQEWQSN